MVEVTSPHRHRQVIAPGPPGHGGHRAGGGEIGHRLAARLGGAPLRGPGRRVPPGRRDARDHASGAAQRRHHAGPEQDGVPGRDRQRLRAHRLLPLQRRLSPSGSTASSRCRRPGCGTGWSTGRSRDSSTRSRRSTSRRSAATCRLRRRSWATRWSGSRRTRRSLSNYYVLQAAGGGGPAARRHQLRSRRAGHVHRRRWSTTGTSPAFTSPDRPRCSSTLWHEVGEPAGRVRLLSADRGRDRRQGLRPGAPERRPGGAGGRRWCAARSSTRARSAARPPGRTSPEPLADGARRGWSP